MRRTVLVFACVWVQVGAAAVAAEGREIPLASQSEEALGAFRRGRDLYESSREFEARGFFQKAIAADNGFALAHAMLARCLAGEAAAKEMETAVSLAAGLGPAERALIEYWRALQRGDDARMEAELTRLGQVAADDWRIELLLGERAVDEGKGEEAVRRFRRAVELNPQAAEAYNHLGFALSDLAQHDAAITAMRRYVALKRDDPNPPDSLGEVLLRAGRLVDSEGSFRRAAAAPQYWYAAAGVATARFFRGDFDGGRAAIRDELPLAPDAAARVRLRALAAWSFFVQGRRADGLAALEEAEREAQAANLFALHAQVAVTRGAYFVLAGEAAAALPALQAGLDRSAGRKLSGAEQNAIRRSVAAWRTRAFAQQGLVTEAAQALRTLEAEAVTPANRGLATVVQGLRPVLAEARGDLGGALTQTALCSPVDWLCRAQRVRLADKRGDTALADQVRRALLEERRRDLIWDSLEPTYLWVWSQLRPPASARN